MSSKTNKKDRTLFKRVYMEVLAYHYEDAEDFPFDPDECPGEWDSDSIAFFEDLESTFGVSQDDWDFMATLKEIEAAVFTNWDGEINGLDEEGNWDPDIAHGME